MDETTRQVKIVIADSGDYFDWVNIHTTAQSIKALM